MVHGLCPPPFPVAVCLRKQRGLPVERWRTVLAALAAQGHELLPWPLYFENGGDAEVLRQCLPEERGARSAEHGAPEAEGMRLAGSGHKGLSAARRKDSRDKTKTQPAIASPAPDTMLSAPCPKPYAPRSALRAPCSIPAEFTLDPVRRAGAVISGRFHGILFALQMGRPVIAVSSLPKTRRFLAENGMEQWCVPEDQPERLLDLWPAFVAKWPELAEAAARVRDRLYSQVTDRAKGTRERLLDDATALPPPPRRRGNRLRQCLDFGQWLDV